MNEVGSISIVGTMDVASIKAGLSQIKKGLGDARESSKIALGDVSLLAGGFKSLGLALIGVGIATATATIGLASMGPAVAPSMARMQRSMFEVTRTVSDALAPSFEVFADLLQGFSDWLGGPDGTVLLQGFNDVLVDIMNSLDSVRGPANKAFDALKQIAGISKEAGESVIDALPLPSGMKDDLKSGISNFLSPGGVMSFIVDRVTWPLHYIAETLEGVSSVLQGDVTGGGNQMAMTSMDFFSGGWASRIGSLVTDTLNSTLYQKYRNVSD